MSQRVAIFPRLLERRDTVSLISGGSVFELTAGTTFIPKSIKTSIVERLGITNT